MGRQPTVFDKLLDGELPCHRVYEDEHVLAFLDIHPLAPGHTLVIPKERQAYLHELSDESASALGRAVARVARAVRAVTGCEAYNVLQNNGVGAHQAVFHVHFHVIPKVGDQGLGIGWRTIGLAAGEAERIAERLRRELES